MNYRKIYENFYGMIPIDDTGRTYEIHHIDGDHTNNNISNLKAVTIREHYEIHYEQQDYAACQAISMRMNMDSAEILKLANLRVENGTHNWLGGSQQRELAAKRVEDGTHHFLDGSIAKKSNKERLDNGKHHMLGGKIQRESARKLVENETHNWLDGEKTRQMQLIRVENGTHHFVQNNPNKIVLTCPHCEKTGPAPAMKRWHFEKCKLR